MIFDMSLENKKPEIAINVVCMRNFYATQRTPFRGPISVTAVESLKLFVLR